MGVGIFFLFVCFKENQKYLRKGRNKEIFSLSGTLSYVLFNRLKILFFGFFC